MSFKSAIHLLLTTFMLFYVMQFAQANVQIGGSGPTFNVTGRVNVTNDTPLGSIISEKFISSAYNAIVVYDISEGTTGAIGFSTTATLSNGNDVYETGTPGIGVRYFVTVSSDPFFGSSQTGEYPIQNGSFKWVLNPTATGTRNFTIPVAVQFVKTGAIDSATTITSIPAVKVTAFNHTTSTWSKTDIVSGTSSVTITKSTCSQPGSPTINLPQVRASAFPSAGSVSGEKPFSIDSNCSGNVKFQFTFKLTSDFYNSSKSILNNKLTGPGAAKGYGIQIVDENNNEIDANNAIYKTTTDSNNFHKSLKARYYRTNDMVQPGKIESALLYTFDYY
ncbi:fimbrial protein [Buttiauxella gaviniae]|uniref:fimbrial protein n=1 Tax=Buttiauxella gaviniae TaxID=82990 RepID=UPI0039AF49D3